jgi:hypothetical protein
VIFYAETTADLSSLPCALPVIRLHGVANAYPPQKKSFMMLRHMHKHFGDNFRFRNSAQPYAVKSGGYLSLFRARDFALKTFGVSLGLFKVYKKNRYLFRQFLETICQIFYKNMASMHCVCT